MAIANQPRGHVVVAGPRSVAVGGDVIGAIITGDYSRVFIGTYQRLRDLYLPASETFARHDPKQFVGREWLATKIDEFLGREQRGYFVLEAEAGVGKSAFLAELVRARRYIHHFVRPAATSRVDAALKSLAAQLGRVL